MAELSYYLQANPVTPDPHDQIARVQPTGTMNQDSVVEEMLKRGTSLTRGDMESSISLLSEVVTDAVANGYFVNLPFCNIRPGIKGVFSSPADSFDKARHVKKATISAGLLLSKKLAEAKVQKTSKAIPSPDVQSYFDVNSGEANSVLTPGGIGTIEGSELKFETSQQANGVFLIDGSGVATRATVYAQVTEGKIVFMVPAGLPTGDYTLEVRRSYTQNNNIRSGQLQESLSVPVQN